MAIKDDIRTALEELMAERSTWTSPQVTPTQTQEQVVAGLVDTSSVMNTTVAMPTMHTTMQLDPSRLQMQNMQYLQSLRMQESMQNQMTTQAFSQGMPGARAPSVSMSDPAFANYQLQNAYMMNPYMSNLIAGQTNGPQLNLAPAQYATSSRLGIFREDTTSLDQGPTSSDDFLRDYVTLNSPFGVKRSYSAYEDVVDEQLASAKNMNRRMESLVSTGITAGTFAASVAASFVPIVGVPLALGIQAVGETASVFTEGYYQRRAETEYIQDLSRQFVTGSGSSGSRGIGYGGGQASRIMSEIRKDASRSASYDVSDYLQVFGEGTDAGVFAFDSNPDEAIRKVKGIVSQIDVFMKMSGDPDIRSAMQRMGQLQTLGLDVNEAQSAMTNMRAFARLAGTSVSNLMETTGAYGAQIAAQTGAPAILGMQVGAMSGGVIRTGQQSGAFSPRELSALGGVEGASQSFTQMALNTMQSALGKNIGAFTKFDSSGNPYVDNDAVMDYARSGVIPGGAKDLASAAGAAEVGMSFDQRKKLLNRGSELMRDALSVMDNPIDQLMLQRSIIKDYTKMHPGASREDVLAANYGDQWRIMDYALSDNSIMSQISQSNQAQMSAVAGRRAKYESENTIFNRVGVAINSAYEDVIGQDDFLRYRGKSEQDKAMRSANLAFVEGLGGITNLNKSFMKFDSDVKSTHVEVLDALLDNDKVYDYLKESTDEGILEFKSRSQRRGEASQFIETAAMYEGIKDVTGKGNISATLSRNELRDLTEKVTQGGVFRGDVLKNIIRDRGEGVAAEIFNAVSSSPKSYDKDTIQAFTDMDDAINAAKFVSTSASLEKAGDRFFEASDRYDIDSDSERSGITGFLSGLRDLPGVSKMNEKDFTNFASQLLIRNQDSGIGSVTGQMAAAGLVGADNKVNQTIASQITGMVRGLKVDENTAREMTYNFPAMQRMVGSAIQYSQTEQRAVEESNIVQRLGIFSTPGERKTNTSLKEDADKILLMSMGNAFTNMDTKEKEKLQEDMQNKLSIERSAGFDRHNNSANNISRTSMNYLRRLVELGEKGMAT